MITRRGRWTLLAAGLAVLPSVVQAQSPQSVPASISVVVAAPPLTLTKVQDFDFGTVYTNQGVIPSGPTNHARWDGSTINGSKITVAFQIPTQLTGPGTVVFACGPSSFVIEEGGLPIGPFDPAAGHAGYTLSNNGTFSILLGAGATQNEACVIDVTGALPGTYTGTVTVTVAVI